MDKIETSSFYKHAIHVKESMTLDFAGTGESDDCNIVTESSTLILDSGVSLTIGEGKTLIPDLYNVFDQTAK